MAGEQTVADLRAVLSAHGFKEAERDMRNVKGQTAGVASGLKSLTDVMNKAGAGAEQAGKQQKRMGMNTNKLNQLVQQASFGIQDFAIVIGQGGLGMALRSASNNAAQMGAIMGGLGGAIAGVGVTLASLIPDMINMFKNTDKATEAMKKQEEQQRRVKIAAQETADVLSRLNEELDRIAKERDIGNAVEDIQKMAAGPEKFKAAGKAVKDAEKDLEDAQKAIEVLRKRRETEQDLGIFVGGQTKLDDVARTLRTRGKEAAIEQAGREFPGEDPEGVLSRIEAENMKRRNEAALRGEAPRLLGSDPSTFRLRLGDTKEEQEERKRGVDKFNEEMADAQRRAANAAERLRRLRPIRQEAEDIEADPNDPRGQMGRQRAEQAKKDFETRKKLAEEFQKDWEKAQKDIADAMKKAQKETQRAAKQAAKEAEDANKNRIKSLQEEKDALQGVLEVIDPAAAKLQKLKEQFGETFGALLTGNLARNPLDPMGGVLSAFGLAGTALAKQRTDAQKRKPDPGISGTFGVADFSRQLQNALLKDDTNKQVANNTKMTAKNTAGITGKLDSINNNISTLKSLRGTFGP